MVLLHLNREALNLRESWRAEFMLGDLPLFACKHLHSERHIFQGLVGRLQDITGMSRTAFRTNVASYWQELA